MASSLKLSDRPRVLIIGGGYVGLYVALKLQKKIKRAGGIVTIVDPLPYMTYQPFLPEVVGGSIEPRHAVVPLREHLPETEYIGGSLVGVDHDNRVATVQLNDGEETVEVPYFDIVMSAGATTRTFPIPGLAEEGIGLKAIEEAVALRDKIVERLEYASSETDPAKRKRALTFVVVGGGFAGIECIAEMEDFARALAAKNPRLDYNEVRFVMVEAMGRIMPEVKEDQAKWVVEHLRDRGIEMLLNTSLADATGGHLKLINMPDKSPASEFDADTLVWAAGVQANPTAQSTGFPLDERKRITVDAKLRIKDGDSVLPNAWSAGDVAAVPDLTGMGPGGFCVPNAQHALRQAKRLASNLWASRFDKSLTDYKHKTIGAVAGLGLWKGVAKVGNVGLSGPLAWLMHRGYHGLAMPTFERKWRVISNWIIQFFAGRDLGDLRDLQRPRAVFEAAAKPQPKPTPKPVEAEKKSEGTLPSGHEQASAEEAAGAR